MLIMRSRTFVATTRECESVQTFCLLRDPFQVVVIKDGILRHFDRIWHRRPLAEQDLLEKWR